MRTEGEWNMLQRQLAEANLEVETCTSLLLALGAELLSAGYPCTAPASIVSSVRALIVELDVLRDKARHTLNHAID